MKKIFLIILIAYVINASAQPQTYTVANAHSHNDYENPVPFHTAYNAGFGSIEADIFLIKGQLIVAHDFAELKNNRSLEDYYLKPLRLHVQQNKGHAYPDTGRSLQMLIDVKTSANTTLAALIELLKKFPEITSTNTIQWVITGNRPADSLFASFPSFIWFDGLLFKDYTAAALNKVVMMSDDFKSYSSWQGIDNLPAADKNKLTDAISRAHALHKKVRFWDAPDNISAWKQFMGLKADYINTDHIIELADYLNRFAGNQPGDKPQ